MKKVKLKNINSSLSDDFDIFVCTSSFESRCLSIPQKLAKRPFYKIIIIENSEGSERIHNNTQALKKLFNKQNCIILSIDYSNPLAIADCFLNEVRRGPTGKTTNMLVDITTFTHETLMILFKVLSIKRRFVNYTFVYSNALDYSPNNEIGYKWLSKGCKDVHSILGFPGLLFPSQKNRLIVIIGYEYNRVADIIYALEPNSLTLVYNSPEHSTTINNKEANKKYLDFLQQMKFDFEKIDSEMIPCDNPDQVCEILSSLYLRYPDENLIVIPMNNKLSTIGVAESIMQNEEVQACYAPAVIYNEEDYSLPGNHCYIIEKKVNTAGK